MGVPMHRRPPLRERTVGTTWRTFRSFLSIVLVLAIIYALVSAGVAITTADTCNGQLRADKEWQYFPPKWKCTSSFPGPIGP